MAIAFKCLEDFFLLARTRAWRLRTSPGTERSAGMTGMHGWDVLWSFLSEL